MYAEQKSVEYSHRNNKRYVVCSITATEAPSPMPETGLGIKNLDPDDILECGTTLFVTSSGTLYMMDDNREFQEVG